MSATKTYFYRRPLPRHLVWRLLSRNVGFCFLWAKHEFMLIKLKALGTSWN